MTEASEMEELRRRVTALEHSQERTEAMLGEIRDLLVRFIRSTETNMLRCTDCPMRPGAGGGVGRPPTSRRESRLAKAITRFWRRRP